MPASTIRVDGHVHLHPCFGLPEFLESAWRNLGGRAGGGDGEGGPGVLMLAECRGDDAFARIARDGDAALPPGWRAARTSEAISMVLERDALPRLVLVAGRQIVTQEGLEVLALGSDAGIADGRPVRETLGDVRAAGALPVLPWGVGKWTFGRRRIVDRLLDEEPADALFVGDNGGRAALLPRPEQLVRAERSGRRVLPGSDPLPLAGETSRVGSFGFELDCALDSTVPATDLLERLRGPETVLRAFGRGVSLTAFLQNLVRMQLRKRLRSRSRRTG